MKIVLDLLTDNYNSYSSETIDFESYSDSSEVEIRLGDRVVGIDKQELIKSIEALCK
ncbi:L-fucose isomerase-like protein [Paenibacillus jamilae]|nr:L-fucose isomerase-like protein [Paenibacillus jamilae]